MSISPGLMMPPDNYIPHSLYHYTCTKTIPNIFMKDCISLLFKSIDGFEDKKEGKLINEYYQDCIKKLYDDNVIDEDECNLLSTIRVKHEAIFFDEGCGCYRPARPYVACFSKKTNDSYMVDNYGHKDNMSAICLEFNTEMLKQAENEKVYFLDVIYENDLRRFLYERLSEMRIENGYITDEIFFMYYRGPISFLLKQLQICSKEEKYKNENEVRLICDKPINFIAEQIFIQITRGACFSICVEDSIKDRELLNVKSHLIENGYSRLSNNIRSIKRL